MSNESKALELARELSMQAPKGILTETHAAAELRRQHTALQDLQTECTALRVNEENLTAQVESLRARLDDEADSLTVAYMHGYNKGKQSQKAPVAQGEPAAWRYQDARGNYRYRGYVPNFDSEYPRLKPVPLYTHPQQASEPMTVISEEAAWSLAQHVYGRSQPYDAPQILLTPKELKTIIESAWSIKGKQ